MALQQAGEAAREIEALMRLHPKGFDLSLDRVTAPARRPRQSAGPPAARHPYRRHERQGLRDGLLPVDSRGGRTVGARPHLAASRQLARALPARPQGRRRHSRRRRDAGGGGAPRGRRQWRPADHRVRNPDGRHLRAVSPSIRPTRRSSRSGSAGASTRRTSSHRPAVSLIMPVSVDHQAYLGDSVELIAAEKAGIIKPGVPVVIGSQDHDAALDVLVRRRRTRARSPTSVFGQDFSAHEEHGRLVYQDEFGLMDLPLPRLPGRHQHANAAAAIRAIKAAGFEVDESAVETGLTSVDWPGRMQRHRRRQSRRLRAGGGRNLARRRAQSRRRRSRLPRRWPNWRSGCRGRCSW